ncbi:scarecrow-like protein 33 [Nymphaea colorata]|uniref:Uncharacterized protein n=1 Tax=Nymphaea colorata TaxID=210225 RepID=A0A5K1EBS5_9MAGN|nr:scarecrow-like protein 33 [Nymphaea colorata]
MFMDPSLEDLSAFLNGFKVDEPFQDIPLLLPGLPPPLPPLPSPPFPDATVVSANGECPEHCEIMSDMLLNYISQMLMDEDMEGKTCMYQECSALQATEKPFYDILGEKYPPSPGHQQFYGGDNPESPDNASACTGDSNNSQNCGSQTSGCGNNGCDSNWCSEHFECCNQNELVSPVSTLPINYSSCPLSGNIYAAENHDEVSVDDFVLPDVLCDDSHVLQFKKGMEEAKKFLPNGGLLFDLQMNGLPQASKQAVNNFLPNGNFVIDLEGNGLLQKSNVGASPVPNGSLAVNLKNGSSQGLKKQGIKFLSNGFVFGLENNQGRDPKKEANGILPNGNLVLDLASKKLLQDPRLVADNNDVKGEDERESLAMKHLEEANGQNGVRRHKNPHWEDEELEGWRCSKHSAISSSSDTIRSEIFDQVLLCKGANCYDSATNLRETMENINSKNMQNGSSKGSNGTKSRNKKQGKREVVDLRAILIHCAQSIATDDYRSANELLKQIRQHSSSCGDGTQRLAHCFAEAVESRLSGTGSQIYSALSTKRTSAASILKAYQLYLAACPFKKLSLYFANQTIMNVAEKATRLHIIDFGILYGFQWPSFIQRLSGRPGGPPKLRITGIDFPQPGFKPAERIEETGQRLSEYARMFNVPFEYKAIAAKWENIKIEDLNLDKDEMLVVNCLYRMRNLFDETVVVDCPRDIVLNKICKLNPKIFVLGIVNGAYSAPFFITRFREALFHFSALFDMLETNVPRDHPERILMERELFGREVLNVVACEGSERVERPETYKQWQVRNRRAGLVQLPLNQEIVSTIRQRVKEIYHKDFVIDEDSKWLLQGWKGRVVQALSTWVPAHHHN